MIAGYRAFSHDIVGELLSSSQYYRWLPGLNEATVHPQCHPACGCGFNAMAQPFPPYEFAASPNAVGGLIGGEGRIRLYQHGFRASQARILALYAGPWPELRHIAERYQVPLLEPDALPAFVAELGLTTHATALELAGEVEATEHSLVPRITWLSSCAKCNKPLVNGSCPCWFAGITSPHWRTVPPSVTIPSGAWHVGTWTAGSNVTLWNTKLG